MKKLRIVLFFVGGVLLLLVSAIVIYSMFYPLPYLHEVVKESPVGVVDHDHSSLSRQLTRWEKSRATSLSPSDFGGTCCGDAAQWSFTVATPGGFWS
jgi:hypothetical protein